MDDGFGMKKERLKHSEAYFLVARHFVTGMDAGGLETRRRLKLKQSSTAGPVVWVEGAALAGDGTTRENGNVRCTL